MNKKEFMKRLFESKKRVDKEMEKFEKHSREFDKKVTKILSGL